MNQPLVSVVIPIYNVEKYLDRCISSVVDQTYRNLEIILVDDGSPDRCPGMCDQWADKDGRIRVIHKENAGLGMARNSGLEAASGKYIFFFDSDDYVELSTVEICVRHAEEHSADTVLFGRRDVYEDGRQGKAIHAEKLQVFRGAQVQNRLLPGLYTYAFGVGVSAWGKMYQREMFTANALRFPSERKIISEDAYFALEYFSKSDCSVLLPDVLYNYVNRDNSLSRGYRKDRQEKNDAFLQTCLDYIRKNDLPDEVTKHLKVRYHGYTIAALKQIMASDLTDREKKKMIRTVFCSAVLRDTLSFDVLRLDKPTVKVFFLLLKFRLFGLCRWLLNRKMRK